MLTEPDIDQIRIVVREEVKDTLESFRSKILTGISDVMGQLKAIRENQDAAVGRRRDLEDRVKKLETIHPGGQHLQ